MLARTVAAALAALLIAGCGITGNFRHDPGYAAFGEPGPLAEDREFGISLGPLPLAFARLVVDDDPGDRADPEGPARRARLFVRRDTRRRKHRATAYGRFSPACSTTAGLP